MHACNLWLRRNRLTINAEKTHFINFSNEKMQLHESISLNIENKNIEEKAHTKYLGLTLQYNLRWDKHIKNIIDSLNSHIPLYYQLRNIIPYNKRILVYKALSFSKINYGIELYCKNESKWTKQLQRTQNRLLKILLSKNKLTGTNKLHKDNNILKIFDQGKARMALLSHRAIHQKEHTNVAYETMKLANQSGRNLRNNLNFITDINYYFKKNKITEGASIIWNNLPQELKLIKNREKFKEAFLKFKIDMYI